MTARTLGLITAPDVELPELMGYYIHGHIDWDTEYHVDSLTGSVNRSDKAVK